MLINNQFFWDMMAENARAFNAFCLAVGVFCSLGIFLVICADVYFQLRAKRNKQAYLAYWEQRLSRKL
jgi:hypothetical protein